MPAANNADNSQKQHVKLARTGLSTMVAMLFAMPVLLGLVGIILPAVGYFPALGEKFLSSEPAKVFLATPGLFTASLLSLKIGLLATFLSLAGSFCLIAVFFHSKALRWLRQFIGPLVAIPHSTIAIGLVFLLAPSGWIMRLISPGLTGFQTPPPWAIIPDPYGLSLVVGLVAKELPFLLLLVLAASATLPIKRLMNVASSLGYGRTASWFLFLLPMIYRQLRLPVIAVLTFSLSVVDMALLLAPSLPPPLAVLVFYGFNDADLSARLPASFGALFQIFLAGVGIALWLLLEKLAGHIIGLWRFFGMRAQMLDPLLNICALIALVPVILGGLGIGAALIWSCARSWFFPDPLPTRISFGHWQDWTNIGPLLGASCWLAILSSCLATAVVFLWLYNQDHRAAPNKFITAALFLPLLVPQVSFLFGLQIGFSWAGLDGSWSVLVYSHMIFIMPYVWLVLAPALAAMDHRYERIAASLGLGAVARFFQIYIPLLAFPLGTALFIGISVSIALYLPTIFVGGGRINTITVEAVSLGANGGRGPAGVAAILQILVPLIGFAIIQLYLKLRFRRFADMKSGNNA
jgi:putative thiamine transport system permease protein